MQKITPFLWFDGKAEEAAKFYTSVFKDSKITKTTRYDEASSKASGLPSGSVMTVAFELNGQEFVGLNGGPEYKFTEAVSFSISCKTQDEIDYYWYKLIEGGGQEGPCGWLKDKFGLSWQVVPVQMEEMLGDKNPEKSQRVMQAMLKMKKLDLNELKKAYQGGKERAL